MIAVNWCVGVFVVMVVFTAPLGLVCLFRLSWYCVVFTVFLFYSVHSLVSFVHFSIFVSCAVLLSFLVSLFLVSLCSTSISSSISSSSSSSSSSPCSWVTIVPRGAGEGSALLGDNRPPWSWGGVRAPG